MCRGDRAKQAASALQWAVSEMERRLKVFERLNVRKISTYNEKQAAGEFEHYDNPPQKMPYLVIIIDELSDLMMVAGKDVEARSCVSPSWPCRRHSPHCGYAASELQRGDGPYQG